MFVTEIITEKFPKHREGYKYSGTEMSKVSNKK
jgi:hypothetical protein